MEMGLFTGFQGRRADPVRNGVTERPLWSHIPGEWELIRGERPAAELSVQPTRRGMHWRAS